MSSMGDDGGGRSPPAALGGGGEGGDCCCSIACCRKKGPSAAAKSTVLAPSARGPREPWGQRDRLQDAFAGGAGHSWPCGQTAATQSPVAKCSSAPDSSTAHSCWSRAGEEGELGAQEASAIAGAPPAAPAADGEAQEAAEEQPASTQSCCGVAAADDEVALSAAAAAVVEKSWKVQTATDLPPAVVIVRN